MTTESMTTDNPARAGNKRVLYIVNPISGRGRCNILETLIENYSDNRRIDFDIAYTKSARHAVEISNRSCQQYDAIVAAGGDGSINEVAQSLIDTDTALGVIPNGSGNGFARHLKIPMKLEKAIKVINNFSTTRIDTGVLNGHPFVNIAGIGFDARIAHKFAVFGKRGFLSYAKISITELLKFTPLDVRITTDSERQETVAFLFSVANGSQFGNNAYIAPEACMQDGRLDVVLLKEFPYISAPALVGHLFSKTFDKSDYADIRKAAHIVLEKKGEILAHLDGEPYTFQDKIDIKVRPASLQVIVPR